MIRRPPRFTRTATPLPYTTLFRSFVRQQVARRHLVLPVGEIADVGAVFRTAVMLEPDPAEIVGDREQEMVIVVMLRSEGLDRLRHQIGRASCRERVCQYV